jgi:hypothetical protein
VGSSFLSSTFKFLGTWNSRFLSIRILFLWDVVLFRVPCGTHNRSKPPVSGSHALVPSRPASNSERRSEHERAGTSEIKRSSLVRSGQLEAIFLTSSHLPFGVDQSLVSLWLSALQHRLRASPELRVDSEDSLTLGRRHEPINELTLVTPGADFR